MNKKIVLGIDMDCILVDMLPAWIDRYNEITKEKIQICDIKNYDLSLICLNTKVLYDILEEPGFFYKMLPMPGAQEFFQKFLDNNLLYDVIVITQPPQKANTAISDKERWMKKYFKNFSIKNMIFCHRKELITCDVLFDDKPEHLLNWKKNNNGLTATLNWGYNTEAKTDFRGDLKNGWKDFYCWITEKNL